MLISRALVSSELFARKSRYWKNKAFVKGEGSVVTAVVVVVVVVVVVLEVVVTDSVD